MPGYRHIKQTLQKMPHKERVRNIHVEFIWERLFQMWFIKWIGATGTES